MTEIAAVDAWEVLDSRGHPTVRVQVTAGGETGTFTVPAGASTGDHEAVERRDGGDRYGGLGVRGAVETVRDELAPLVVGCDVTDQTGVDESLADYDGTDDFSAVGANAALGVSGGVAHAASAARDEPLYEYLARDSPGRIPLPMVNVVSGGLHASRGPEIQDFLVVPVGADAYPDALEVVWDVRSAVGDRIAGDGSPLVADEGGFSPDVESVDDAFDLLAAGVRDAGYDLGGDVAFAVDVAAAHFYDAETDRYVLDSVGRSLTRDGMVDLVAQWVDDYPLVSVEDPLTEDDWEGWATLADRIGDEVQVLGDDLLVTNESRLDRAVDADAANAVLVKPNQTGTLTGARRVVEAAKEAGWATVVSARSGETCDATIADFAVALDAGQIKVGSLARSERLAKYNRLLAIDRFHDGEFAGRDALVPRNP
ncbi:phosphopyruvate hydratase [Salinirarus marinus]|uniref:phosphopyruvate hydratase n=1 Tax=Salinirarus marinus TaxID=3068310 RepID=UPI003C6CB564